MIVKVGALLVLRNSHLPFYDAHIVSMTLEARLFSIQLDRSSEVV